MKTPKTMIDALIKKGHTQESIGKGAKIPQTTISRWSISEPKRPSIDSVARLTKFYNKVFSVKAKK